MERPMKTDIVKHDNTTTSLVPSEYDKQMEFFAKLAEASYSGIKTVGDAIIAVQKCNELGIGWANAIGHVHVISGTPAIDYNIINAVISKPGSGIRYELIEDFVPIYQYSDGVNIFTEDTLPKNSIKLPNLKDKELVDRYRNEGKLVVTILPTKETYIEKVGNKNIKKERYVVKPYDYRTTYQFTRKKMDIDNTWFTVKPEPVSYTWREALKSGKPYDKEGNLNETSAWQAYRKIMMRKEPFKIGAKAIAGDLIYGGRTIDELAEIHNVDYHEEVTEEGDVTIIVDDKKNNK